VKIVVRVIILLFLLVILPLANPSEIYAVWQSVGTGIEYQKFTLPDPNNVFVTRMNRSTPSATLESSIGQGKLVSGRETISSQAARYDQAINYWGQSWGSRNDVVVAINGSFEEPGADVPASGQIHSGWYAKRFGDVGGSSGFAWHLDRSAFIGQCVFHRPEKQFITFTSTGITQRFDGINFGRGSNELVIYTPQYDSDTNTDASGVEVLVEMTRPSLILPEPAMAKGFVREIRDGQGSTAVPFDHVVLSATGTARTTLLNNISVGEEIGISQEITEFAQGCSGAFSGDWTKTYASISGSFEYLANGVIESFDDPGATARHPRTAIAFNNTYIFYIVVDGRAPGTSIGMSIDELALFTRDTLGATWGINQDGGGSSTMVVNGVVRNNPSDGSERPVVNGMMMIVSEPIQKSTTFASDDTVATVSSADVRLGPGTNYAISTSVPTDTEGVVLAHFNNLDGVFAKGSNWWKVAFGSTVGWVTEESLRSNITPTGFIVESRVGGLNFGNYSDSGFSDSSLKSTAVGTTLGIGSREGALKKAGPTRSATFSFTADTTGTYEVLATWAVSSTNHTVVEHLVGHDGGLSSVLVNQALGENTWNSLGQYSLTAGNSYTVRITNENFSVANKSSKVFRADAVRWKLISATAVGSILGKVTKVDDGTPISGVTVLVEDTNQSATTDGNGDYLLSDVATGSHTLTASVTGFASSSQTVTVVENATSTANFALTSQTTPTTAIVDSVSYATEGGRYGDKHLNIIFLVVDNTGQPVAGASVSIDLFLDSLLITSFSGTTVADGSVTFTRKNAVFGCYTNTVTDVTAQGLIWDGVTPANQFCK